MICHANVNQKKAGMAILVSQEADWIIKNISRDKEGFYIMIMDKFIKRM